MIKNNLDKIIENQLPQINKKIRDKAIKRVKKDLILHGKIIEDLSEEDLEFLIAEAEMTIWQYYKEGGRIALAALIGITWF